MVILGGGGGDRDMGAMDPPNNDCPSSFQIFRSSRKKTHYN